MDCKYAYMKDNIEYVLCKKEPTPNRLDRTAVFHSMCAHQVDCPKRKCHKLSASWERCAKLAVRNRKAYDSVFHEDGAEAAEAPGKPKKTRRKPKTEE